MPHELQSCAERRLRPFIEILLVQMHIIHCTHHITSATHCHREIMIISNMRILHDIRKGSLNYQLCFTSRWRQPHIKWVSMVFKVLFYFGLFQCSSECTQCLKGKSNKIYTCLERKNSLDCKIKYFTTFLYPCYS